MDWDEELKRQAAISALLAPPEAEDTPDVPYEASTSVVKPEDTSDYHKWVNQTFDTKTDEQVTSTSDYPAVNQDQGIVYPPIAEDQGAPDKKFDTAVAESVVPYDERKKPEQPPSPYTQLDTGKGVSPEAYPVVAQDQGAGEASGQQAPDALTQVERGLEWREPWHPAGTPTPASAVKWEGNKLVDKDGNVVADETPPAKEKPAVVATTPTPTPADQAPAVKPVAGGEGFWGGDLSQGPPGTKPDGTENEPYWPRGDKDVALLPPGVNYIDPKDQSVKVTPGAPAAPAVTPSDQAKPTVTQAAPAGDWDSFVSSLGSKTDSKEAPTTTETSTEPIINAPNGQAPVALIIHHTGGNNSPESVVDDWRTNRPGVGAQMIIDRDGTLHYTQKEFGYGGTGNFLHSVIPGVSNQTAVGVEVVAKDDDDMTPAELKTLQRIASGKGPYANIPVYGHSQVSPGDRENEGVRGVAAINEARAAGGATVTDTEEPPINTLVKLDQSGLHVTHFGYEKPGEEGWDQDSAKGNGKYVENLIPGYDVALNSAGAALVGNPKPGETFQFAGKEWRYGDAVSEKLTDPRFDIFDPTGAALTGEMPVGKSVVAAGPEKMPWDDWKKLSPEEQTAIEQKGTATLDKLNQGTQNPGEFWRTLQQPIPGVSDVARKAYADNFKKEVTKYAQDFYGEKDPEKAFSKAVGDPGFEAYVSNIGRGLAGAVGQADVGIALAGKSIDNNRVDGFAKLVHPDSSTDGRAAFIKTLTDIKDTRHRHDVFNEIYGNLDQNTKDAIGDPASILDSIDHLASPEYQTQLNRGIAIKKAWVNQQLQGDPSLKGTAAGWWTTGTGENIFNTVASLVPGGIGAVVRGTTFGSQIYSSNLDKIAQENPSWSSDKVSDEAAKSSFLTLLPQEVVMALSHGITAPLLKWVGAAAEKPIVRFGIGGGVQVAAAATGGALGQVGENIAEKKDPLANVPQAVGSAVVQSLPFAIHGGLHGLSERPAVEEAPPPPEVKTEAPPPETTRPVTRTDILGTQEEYTPEAPLPWYKEGVTPSEQHDPLVIRGAERTTFTPEELRQAAETVPAQATPEDLRRIQNIVAPTGWHLGAEDEGVPEQPQVTQKGKPRPGPAQPLDLASAIRAQKIAASFPTNLRAERVAASLGATPAPAPKPVETPQQGFPSQAHFNVYRDLVQRGMDEAQTRDLVSKAKGNTEADILKDVQAQMRNAGKSPPPQPGNINGEETWASREANKSTAHSVAEELTKGVANKYAEERVKAGELEPIDPNTGLTTEELMARARKMAPAEVQGHIDDFMGNRGGDPRDHAAAVRRREAFLTDRNRALSLKADANPRNAQAQADAAAARGALNDFYSKGGPISKMKENFHVHGIGLQGEPKFDLSTSGGLEEKYLRETGRPSPPVAKPRLKKAAERVRETHSDEYKARDKVDKAIDKDARSKIPSIEEVRDYVAKRMTEMPCRK